MEKSNVKFIEERWFYKIFNFCYKYVLLNSGFFLTTYVWLFLARLFTPSILGLSFYGFALFIGMINFCSIIRIYTEDDLQETEPSYKRLIRHIKETVKTNTKLILLFIVSSFIVLIDLYFIAYFMNIIYFLPVLMVVIPLYVATMTWALIVQSQQKSMTVKEAVKIGFILATKNWVVSIGITGLLIFFILALFIKSELGFLFLPAFVFLYIYKFYLWVSDKVIPQNM